MKEKRYYWLKLEETYFDLKIQKALRKLPSGAEMLICYLKMQLKYLNKSGLIEYQGIYDNLAEEIALDIDEDIDIVKMTISVLIKWHVIEQEESNLYLTEMQTRIGSKTDSALRVAKHREKMKMLQCNNDVTKCNSIQEIELEKDKELDIDKKEKNKKEKYGEFNNVLLTKEEYAKLEKSNLLTYIERLSSYIASTGKKYKSHYATILNWNRKEKNKTVVNNYMNNVPNWMNENIEEEQATPEEIKKIEERLNKF